jgi:hypothetical protein
MWVFTTDGFYSVVEHREHPSLLLVRARDEGDLQRLRKHLVTTHGLSATIQHTPDGDYAWRMTVPRDLWTSYLQDAVEAIEYRNFKDAVTLRQGWQRSSLYHNVWATMMQLQHEGDDVVPDDPRGREARRG